MGRFKRQSGALTRASVAACSRTFDIWTFVRIRAQIVECTLAQAHILDMIRQGFWRLCASYEDSAFSLHDCLAQSDDSIFPVQWSAPGFHGTPMLPSLLRTTGDELL